MTTVTLNPLSYPGDTLILPLGLDVPRFKNGIAKWNQVDRPRRRAMMEFVGESCGVLTFDVMLDEFPDGNVEWMIGRIFGWAAIINLPFQPTLIQVSGPVPYTQLDYILTDVDDSGIVERRVDGNRCRQQLKLELTEYVAPDLLGQVQPSPPAQAAQQRAGTASSGSGRTYTVRKGDTLSGIAAKQLNNAGRWHEIANLNGIRDPRRLQIGTVLRLP